MLLDLAGSSPVSCKPIKTRPPGNRGLVFLSLMMLEVASIYIISIGILTGLPIMPSASGCSQLE